MIMSLVALHNGGGTGIGKAINGGFGLVLDGSERIDEIIKSAIAWDTIGRYTSGLAMSMLLRQLSSTTVSMKEQTTSPFHAN